MKSSQIIISFFLILSVLFVFGAAFAQIPDDITGLKLGAGSLTMAAGDTYTFNPEITTKEVSGATNITLRIYSSDENVVRVTDQLNTVEAVGGGEAQLWISTAGFEFSTACAVKVSGEAKSVVAKGEPWESPSKKQLAKVTDTSLQAFFGMLDKPEMASAASALARQNKFRALVTVTPGETAAAADLMRELGMSNIYAFERISTVAVKGTAEQFGKLLASENILSINEDEITFSEAVPNTGPLQGQAETISHFSTAYGMGLDGTGTAVAIIDCGVNPEHEQFTEKEGSGIIYEACFCQDAGTDGEYTLMPSCANNTGEDLTSGWINDQVKASEFNHGTHVAAIAAGKDGVAPKADLITVNVFTQIEYECSFFGIPDICTSSGSLASDQIRAFEYLSGLIENEGVNLAAINMSLGGGEYAKACSDDPREEYVRDLLDLGAITAAASGNEYLDKKVTTPACLPSSFAVGAVWDSGTPQVADYSNHSQLVDILAPGTQINSAVPTDPDAYEVWNGTSMATPMVSGAIALLRQQFPDASAEMVEAILTGITDKTAVRGKISKPVLDLTNLPAAAELIANGPAVSVYGGDKLIQLEFGKTPISVAYKLTLNTVPASAKPVKTVSGKNLQTVKFTKLTNDKQYEITVDYTIAGIDREFSVSLKGMPMKQTQSFTIGWEPSADGEEDSNPTVKFGWAPEDSAEMVVNYSQGDNSGTLSTAEAGTEWAEAAFDEIVSAAFFKRMTVGEDSYWSLPTVMTTLPLGTAAPVFYDVFNTNIYISFDEPMEGLTGREVRISKLDIQYSEDYTEIISETSTPIKTEQFPVKKYPTDILLKGPKEEMTIEIEVRNYVTVGKDTYYSDWFKLSRLSFMGDPVYNFYNEAETYRKDNGGETNHETNLAEVSFSAADKAVSVSYHRNLLAAGYHFMIKPVEPNTAIINQSVSARKARNGYTVSGLENGTVYKMRIRWYSGSASKPLYTHFYPNNSSFTYNEGDSSWLGVYFIPMPAPVVSHINNDGTLVVTSDGSLDKLAIIKVNGTDPNDTEITYMDIASGDNLIDPECGENVRSLILMYAKEYNEHVYYGPAAYVDPIFSSANEMNIGYGAKIAEEMDLTEIPALAGAAQIGGVTVFTKEEPEPKGIEEEIEAPAKPDNVFTLYVLGG